MKTIGRSELPQRGAPLGGGFYTAEFQINGLFFAMVTAGKEAEIKGEWGKYGEKIEGAASFVDGLANTEAMAAAGLEIAITVRAMRFGGQDDWAIPARNQQEAQHRRFKPTTRKNYCSYLDGYNPDSVPAGELYTPENPLQTTIEAFREGGAEAFEAGWYLSSTQYSANYAFIQGFHDGHQHYYRKDRSYRVRPVRMIQIIN